MKLPGQIASKFVVDDNGCWIWQKSLTGGGYGYINWQGKTQKATRLIYTMLVGEIPTGLQLDHLCRVRACVNPAHLEPVTNRENAQRGMKAVKTHCIGGHERNDLNTLTRPDGRRMCRVCNRDRMRAKYKELTK